MRYFVNNGIIEQRETVPSKDYVNWIELTTEQIAFYLSYPNATIDEILNQELTPISFEQKQLMKLTEINSVYANKMIQGYFDSETNITLKLFKDDRDAFNQLITDTFVINDTEPTTSVYIADVNGVIHQLTDSGFKSLMQRYGAYYKQLWGTLLYFENLVKVCKNEDELNQVVWD